jgi:predicted aminopeptidase
MTRFTFSIITTLVLLVAAPGCDIGYFAHLAVGELASLSSTMPIEAALQDTRLSEEQRAKLDLTQSVRQFGIDTVGLFAGSAYTVFEMNGSEPAAFVLSASAKDSLTPYYWTFPLIGRSEVKGYFDEDYARREGEQLLAQGYDVFLGRADGFSTLGILPDPVRESNLEMDEIDLAELLLHEMTHSTVIKLSDVDFIESVATFVGRTAAQAWIEHTFGVDSAEAIAAGIRFSDKEVIDEYVNATFQHMSTYYAEAAARGEPPEVIIAGRQAEFEALRASFETDYLPRIADQERWGAVGQVPLDNATLLAGIRYQASLSDYAAVLEKVGGSFPDAIHVFKEAAGVPDSRQFLREWVQQQP